MESQANSYFRSILFLSKFGEDEVRNLKPWGYTARFFASFCVIWSHILSPLRWYGEHIASSIYLTGLNEMMTFFTMPLLIFLLGFFSSPDLNPFRAQQLLVNVFIPYLMYNVAIQVYFRSETFLLEPAVLSWFLLCMFYWNFLLLFLEHIKYSIPLTIFISVLIGCTPKIGYFLSLSRCFFFLPFFLAGYLYKKNGTFIQLKKWFSVVSILVIFGINFYFHQWVGPTFFLGSESYVTMGISNEIGMIARICFYPFAFWMIFAFLSLIPQKPTIFSPLGKNSLYAYLGQAIVLLVLLEVHFYQHPVDWMQEIIGILLAFISAVVLSTDTSKRVLDLLLRPKWLIRLFLRTDQLDNKIQKPPA